MSGASCGVNAVPQYSIVTCLTAVRIMWLRSQSADRIPEAHSGEKPKSSKETFPYRLAGRVVFGRMMIELDHTSGDECACVRARLQS